MTHADYFLLVGNIWIAASLTGQKGQSFAFWLGLASTLAGLVNLFLGK